MEERYGKKTWLGAKSNTLVFLIALLVIVFCIFTFIHLAYRMTDADKVAANARYTKGILSWFILPSNLNSLLERPWTVLTYMFLHGDVFHLIGNMIWLWVFGYILQDLTGGKTIIPLFIYGGLCGAAIFLLALNTVPGLNYGAQGIPLVGASAGIMAIAIATTVLAPGYRFFPMINGGIPLWVITVIYVVIDLAKIAADDNAGGHVSHLGGAIFGFIFMKQYQRGRDWSAGMSKFFDWVNDLANPAAKVKPSSRPKEELYYNTSGTQPYRKVPNLTQKRIDAILDKIGEKGYQQLTEEEKQILKRAAEDENL
jgi:membrane associated rhomboid family serine protease